MHFDLKKFVCLYALLLHMQLTRLVVERGLQNNKKKETYEDDGNIWN